MKSEIFDPTDICSRHSSMALGRRVASTGGQTILAILPFFWISFPLPPRDVTRYLAVEMVFLRTAIGFHDQQITVACGWFEAQQPIGLGQLDQHHALAGTGR